MDFPSTLSAGDSLSALVTLPAYPASAGWVLHVRLVARTHGNTALTLDGTAESDSHRIAAAASATADWAADAYTVSAWVTRSTEVITVERARMLNVLPNLRTVAAGYDGRSLALRTLEDLKAAKAGWDTSGGRTRSYKIVGREMEFVSELEIVQKIAFWENEVRKEVAAGRLAAGLPPRNRILTRFVRPR